jgi:hypothetical protein
MFFKIASNGNDPEVVQPLGTGPMMLLKALGFDPTILMEELLQFQRIIKGGIDELVARMKAIDESLAELKQRVPTAEDQIEAREREKRIDENLTALSAAFCTVAAHLERIEAKLPQEPEVIAAGTPLKQHINGKRKLQ